LQILHAWRRLRKRDLTSLAVALIILGNGPAGRALAHDPTGSAAYPAWKCGSDSNELNNSFYADNALLEDHAPNSPAPLPLAPAQGDAKRHLDAALELLRKKPYIQSFLVAKSNRIIFEDYFNGMSVDTSANVHSASKSIWGAAIGIAIAKGILPAVDTPIKQLLPAHYTRYFDAAKDQITLKHLLTMSSCFNWEEDVTEDHLEYIRDRDGNGRDWIAAILNREMRPHKECTLGRTFGYSTGNSQLISAILQEALNRKNIAQSTCEFIQENIFDKIGIAADKWAFYRQGYFAGGHSLWLSPKELMTFGLLYLNNGRWKNDQIIPKDWVIDSKSPQVKCQSPGCSITDDSRVPDGYGYYFWLGRMGGHRVAMSWGYGGQMIYIFDDLDAAVVVTTNTVKYTYDDEEGGLQNRAIKGERHPSDTQNVPERSVMDYIERVVKDEVIAAVK
jgi:CubicO group peptidase (beta-lactamase class C family)